MKTSSVLSRLSDTRVILALSAVLLLVAGGAAWLLLRSGPGQFITAADYTVLRPRDVENRVPVNATVESRHSVALSTHLSGAVEQVHVRVGDRVQEGQVLAEIDVSGVQKEIDTQRAQQITTDAANLSQVEQAQQQQRNLQESVDQGLHPQITAAEAALRQAESQYGEAQRTFEDKRGNVEQGADAELHARAAAVDTARRDVHNAAIDGARAGLTVVNAALSPGGDTLTPLLGQLQSDERYAAAEQNLDTAQKNYEITLHQRDQELATQQRAVAQAFAARTEAAVALEATRLGVQQQLATNVTAVEQATRALAAAQSASGQSVSRLQVDIAAREARAPMTGVVTALGARQGTAASGPLATIADPERLVLRTNLKEVDAAKVSTGDAVTFTTPSTGTRQYTGRVLSVSPVGTSAAPATSGENNAPSTPRPEFPVEIEVTGDVKDLRIGGSAKVQIVTEKAARALAVPREALIEEDGRHSVLVLRPAGGEHEVVQVPVTVGILTDFEATVTGVKADDKVLNQASVHRASVGQRVGVEKQDVP